MGELRLYVIVFISGAAVLALEILGTRILGPFYGVSLFLWSALITVTLAALSVGYALGGRWADRGPRFGRLGALLVIAAAWVLLIPLLTRPVLAATEALGLRAAVLITATLLFAPPLTLLGMVSPYAIRLKASSLESVGRTAGDLYAVSTVASVVSALAMGFFLIPAVGVARLTYGIGLALVLAGALALVGRAGRGQAWTIGLLIVAVAAGTGLVRISDTRPDPDGGLVAVRHSPYAEIRVLDTRDARHLLIDGGIHSMIDPETWRSWHPYSAAVDVLKSLWDGPGSLLLIGLGGGSIAKSFAADGWQVDAVEIDPVIGEVAAEYFGLEAEECRTYYMDGRRYLLKTEKSYDLIVVDAYGSSAIPFHLITVESFGLMASRLAPEGVLALNVETHGWHDPVLGSLTASLRRHFDRVIAMPTIEPPDALGNIVLVASSRALEFDEYARLPRPYDHVAHGHDHWWAVQMTHAWDNRFEPKVTAATVLLTDDRNAVDVWSERIHRQSRRELHAYFRGHGPSW